MVARTANGGVRHAGGVPEPAISRPTTGKRGRNQIDVEVAKRVRTLRLQRHLSQADLSQALGVTFQQVQKYERGANRISAGRLCRIAEALDVPVAFFFADLGSAQKGPAAAGAEFDFLQTPGAMRLIEAYARIKDPGVRLTLMRLAEALAGEK
jgi:transcriptional regulator with XRE-family HTH domain